MSLQGGRGRGSPSPVEPAEGARGGGLPLPLEPAGRGRGRGSPLPEDQGENKSNLVKVLTLLKGLSLEEISDVRKTLQFEDAETDSIGAVGGRGTLVDNLGFRGDTEGTRCGQGPRPKQYTRFSDVKPNVGGLPVLEEESSQAPIGTGRPSLSSGIGSVEQSPKYFMSSPRLPTFTGGHEGEVSYRHWRAEVLSLAKDVTVAPHSLLQLVRRSLKGMARDCLLQLGEDVDVSTILSNLDDLFGDVLSREQLLEQFYSAQQTAEENVACWGCRLRDILSRCLVSSSDPDFQSMLRRKFWTGLYQDRIRDATRHRFDNGATFEELLVACRTVEQERVNKSSKDGVKKVAQVQQLSDGDKLDLVLKKIRDLEAKVASMERKEAWEKDAARVSSESQRNDALGTSEKTHEGRRHGKGRGKSKRAGVKPQ